MISCVLGSMITFLQECFIYQKKSERKSLLFCTATYQPSSSGDFLINSVERRLLMFASVQLNACVTRDQGGDLSLFNQRAKAQFVGFPSVVDAAV